jgi:hypothetical protein
MADFQFKIKKYERERSKALSQLDSFNEGKK